MDLQLPSLVSQSSALGLVEFRHIEGRERNKADHSKLLENDS